MNVLFINPRYDERQYRYKVNKLCPPLGMAYLASIVRGRGHCPAIIDMEAVKMDWDHLGPAITRTGADVVGIHGTTPVCTYIARAAAIAREALPQATIIVGGPHATLLPEAVLNDMPQVDYLLRGEAEQTFPELLGRLQQGARDGDLHDIPGIGLRDGGRLVISGRFGEAGDLDALPLPAYDLLPLDAYFEGSRLAETGTEGPIFTMMSSRGCPHACIFCCDPVLYGHRYRARSARSVVDEMSVLVHDYGTTHIVFYDAAFMIDARRVQDICQEILRRGLKVTWRVRARADRMTEELLRLMKQAGCTTVAIGAETGTQRLLDVLNKHCTLADIENAFAAARRVGLWTVGYFILGVPTETREDALQTVEFAKRLDPDWALFTHATPLPGTKLLEMSGDRLLTRDWTQYKFSANSPVLARDGMSPDETRRLMDYAFRSFYLRKEWLVNRLEKVTTPAQRERVIDSFLYYVQRLPAEAAV